MEAAASERRSRWRPISTGSGGLVGKLTLNDHGGFSIQAGPVVQAFLTGSNAFLVNGTYVANDGSAQTWTVAGDATMQSSRSRRRKDSARAESSPEAT